MELLGQFLWSVGGLEEEGLWMGAPDWDDPLRVLPGLELQASRLGGSLATSLENHLWVRGGWLIRACSRSGS